MKHSVFGLLVFLLACAACPAQVIFQENFDHALAERWKPLKFEGRTEYVIAREGTNSFLRGTANATASGLAVELQPTPANGAVISWRWKIDRVPPGGSEDEKKTFDHTARLFVAFKTFLGPPRSVNYVWANQTAVGKTFHHPSSGRSRFIVLESGNEKAGQWMTERRDVAQDWKLLFGDDPPEIVGLGFMTDADGTESKVTGCYDQIELRRDSSK
jgi:hypothetical protein